MKVEGDEHSKRMAEVLRRHLAEGKGVRAIARETKLDRKTVRRLLGLSRGEVKAKDKKERGSILDPYEDEIRRLLEASPEIRAPAVLDRLRPKGYRGGVSVLRDLLHELRPRSKPEAFLTLSYQPGQILQVDWADFGFALPGCPRRVSAFVAGLAYSRYLYLEFTVSQSHGSLLRCLDRTLHFLGGRCEVEVFDNMKTVVKERTLQATVFNPRFLEYARARGFSVRACNPGRGNEKPYAERPIGFVRTRFWPGRRFSDLFDLNVQAAKWRDEIANQRIHESTGKIPALVFKNEEQRALAKVVDRFFDTDDLESCSVSKTFRVAFDRNVYSVPWRLVGQAVLVRANDVEVGIYLGPKRVAVHNRSWGVGQSIVDPSHEQGLLELKPGGAAGMLPRELLGLGEAAAAYFKILAANGRSLRRETERLVLLTELYGDTETRTALEQVMATGHVGADYVEYVLRHKRGLSAADPLRLSDEALNGIRLPEPDLGAYDAKPQKTLDPGDPPPEESR